VNTCWTATRRRTTSCDPGRRGAGDYLINEIQEVYRLQGVPINDKHIEVIVRQMLQKIEILDAGDSGYLAGEHVDKIEFLETNDALGREEEAAVTEPVLLGITKASLQTAPSSPRPPSRRPPAC
jgi:DNA-directed RNA polymerase subunit beta'